MEDWREVLSDLVGQALSGLSIEEKDLTKAKKLMKEYSLKKEKMSPFARCVEETVAVLNALSNMK